MAVRGGTGMGKTATAAKLLDSVTEDDFPDGRMYVDLDNLEPTEAMHSLLLRLGADATRIPTSLEGKKPSTIRPSATSGCSSWSTASPESARPPCSGRPPLRWPTPSSPPFR
ncbi:hypothetical protein GCM10029992_56050 [Glycomyces albus]